jgi:hypothetical protein
MPAALVHALLDQRFILIRRGSYLSTMPLLITKQASGNDVMLLRRSAILVSLKVFAGTLKALGLTEGDLML